MTLARLAATLGFLIAAGVAGCADRQGPDVMNGGGQQRQPNRPGAPDGGSTTPTTPSTPTVPAPPTTSGPSMNRYRSGGGCHLIGCLSTASLRVVVASFYRRFMDQGQTVDVEICHAGTCSKMGVQLRDADGGVLGGDLVVELPDGSPNLAGIVRLKVSKPSGATILEEERMARDDVYCPNGYDCQPQCPIRRASFEATTDAGQPADADPDPYQPPIDRTCKAP